MSEPPAAVPPRTPAPVASVGRAVAACALYGTSSVAITFFNKAVFSVFHFHYPVFMTLVQILFCLAALRIANALGLYVFFWRWKCFPVEGTWAVALVGYIAGGVGGRVDGTG